MTAPTNEPVILEQTAAEALTFYRNSLAAGWRAGSSLCATYLSAVERAERNVSIDNIARIAKGLRVEPSVLLKDT
jgi:glycerol-3-phosphate O-acyltransferase